MRIRHVNNCRAKTDAKIFPNKTNPTTFPSDFWRSLQPLFDPDLSTFPQKNDFQQNTELTRTHGTMTISLTGLDTINTVKWILMRKLKDTMLSGTQSCENIRKKHNNCTGKIHNLPPSLLYIHTNCSITTRLNNHSVALRDNLHMIQGSLRGEHMLKVFKMHFGRNCEPFSGQKCTRLLDFAYTLSTFFWGDTSGLHSGRGDPLPHPYPARPSAPGAWTQTQISVWLVSIPFLQNDYCLHHQRNINSTRHTRSTA